MSAPSPKKQRARTPLLFGIPGLVLVPLLLVMSTPGLIVPLGADSTHAVSSPVGDGWTPFSPSPVTPIPCSNLGTITVTVNMPASSVVPGQELNVTVTVTCPTLSTPANPSDEPVSLSVSPALATVVGSPGDTSSGGVVIFPVIFASTPTVASSLSFVASYSNPGGDTFEGTASVLLAPPVITVGVRSLATTLVPGQSDHFDLSAENGSGGPSVARAIFNFTIYPSVDATLFPLSTIVADSTGRATIWVNASAGAVGPLSLLLNVTAWLPGHEQGSGAGSVSVATPPEPAITATLTVSHGTVVPGGSLTVTVNATTGGTPITGALVLLTASPHLAGTISPASSLTNPSGQATFTFNASKLASSVISVLFEATVNDSGYDNGSAAGSATINPPFLIMGATVSPSPVDEGAPAALTFSTQSASGPISASVTLHLTPASAGTLNSTSGTSSALGLWTVTLNTSTASATPYVAQASVVASAPGFRSTPFTQSFSIVPSPLAVGVESLPSSAVAGTVLTLTGAVTNLGDNAPEVNGLVTVTPEPSWAATVMPASLPTNASGGFTTTVTISTNLTTGVALTLLVSASAVGAVSANATAVLLAYGSSGTAPASRLVLRVGASSVVPGQTVGINATVLNATDGKALAGVPVTLSVSSSVSNLGTLSPGTVVDTNSEGLAEWSFQVNSTLTSPVAALVTALAVPTGLAATSTSSAFEVVPAASRLGIAVQAPSELTSGATGELRATVTLTSASTGVVSPVAAATVTALIIGGGQISFGTTDTSGLATLNYSAPLLSEPTAVLIEVQVSLLSQIVNETVRIVVEPMALAAGVSFANGATTAHPGQSVPTVVTVTSGGSPVADAQVTLQVLPSWAGSILSVSGTTTGTTGQVTFSLATVANVSGSLAITVEAFATDPGHWNSTATATVVLSSPSAPSSPTIGSVLSDPVDLFLLALVILLAILLAVSTFYGFGRDEEDRKREQAVSSPPPVAVKGSEGEAEGPDVEEEAGSKVTPSVAETSVSAVAPEESKPAGRLVSIGKGQWSIQGVGKEEAETPKAPSVPSEIETGAVAPAEAPKPSSPSDYVEDHEESGYSEDEKPSTSPGELAAPSGGPKPPVAEEKAPVEPASQEEAPAKKPATPSDRPQKVEPASSERRERRKERRQARKKDSDQD